MFKKVFVFTALFIFVVSLNGCATVGKKKDLEIQGLKNQISVLETQLEAKDAEINSLKEALNKATAEKGQLGKKKIISEVKERPNTRQIQLALKNAGFEPGKIDGKMGRQTRQAIKAFQKANNLVVDGKVSDETWSLLRKYLYQKIK